MIEVVCPCGRVHAAPDEAAGKALRCKACGAVVPVPIPETVAAESGEPFTESGRPAAHAAAGIALGAARFAAGKSKQALESETVKQARRKAADAARGLWADVRTRHAEAKAAQTRGWSDRWTVLGLLSAAPLLFSWNLVNWGADGAFLVVLAILAPPLWLLGRTRLLPLRAKLGTGAALTVLCLWAAPTWQEHREAVEDERRDARYAKEREASEKEKVQRFEGEIEKAVALFDSNRVFALDTYVGALTELPANNWESSPAGYKSKLAELVLAMPEADREMLEALAVESRERIDAWWVDHEQKEAEQEKSARTAENKSTLDSMALPMTAHQVRDLFAETVPSGSRFPVSDDALKDVCYERYEANIDLVVLHLEVDWKNPVEPGIVYIFASVVCNSMIGSPVKGVLLEVDGDKKFLTTEIVAQLMKAKEDMDLAKQDLLFCEAWNRFGSQCYAENLAGRRSIGQRR